jgi:hypothetical protein
LTDPLPKTTSIVNYYGSNRMLAHHVGAELKSCTWVGVGCAGSMTEILYMDARTIAVNDLHRPVINLAEVMADRKLGPILYRRLRRKIFHPDQLAAAQELAGWYDQRPIAVDGSLFKTREVSSRTLTDEIKLDWAEAYFTSSWMGRGSAGGTDAELKSKLPKRWNAGGGGSSVRYFSAVDSIRAWRKFLRRCEFSSIDIFEFLARCEDEAEIGIYVDPPFPGPGDLYIHQLGDNGQERLATAVARFKNARVVMRFYDVPLIRKLYPEDRWTWVCRDGRTQTNGPAKEVLILNGPSRVALQ